MYKCCIEISKPFLFLSRVIAAPHVQMLYWNLARNVIKQTILELHMYKCCIEIRLDELRKKTEKELHMYKCCIEIEDRTHSKYHYFQAPHVQMLYWNIIKSDTSAYADKAPHVQMLYWNKAGRITQENRERAPHVQMLYWNLLNQGKASRCDLSSTCTNVVLK